VTRSWAVLLGDEKPGGGAEEREEEREGRLRRLRSGLAKSRRAIVGGLTGWRYDPSDIESWEALEEALISADVGVATTQEVIERLENTLRTEFMSSLSQTRRRDAHETMAEIFNSFDRQTETRFITALEEANRESAERIKALMFTFDDLVKLDAGSAQTLMRHVDKDKLAVALKGATDTVRQFFLGNMSTRAAKMLVDDMSAMGPVRLRDVDEAQALLVNLAKDLAAKGEIMIAKSGGDEELIY